MKSVQKDEEECKFCMRKGKVVQLSVKIVLISLPSHIHFYNFINELENVFIFELLIYFSMCKYLVCLITSTDDYLQSVIVNIQKMRNIWICLSRIFGWEGVHPSTSGCF